MPTVAVHNLDRELRQNDPNGNLDLHKNIEGHVIATESRSRPQSCWSSYRQTIGAVIFVVSVIVIVVCLFIYFFGDTSDIPGIGYFRDIDPFAGLDADGAAKWRTNNFGAATSGGLDITILNALEEKWQPYFQQAVYDWENGSPDALTLTTEQVPVDPDCSTVDGVIKICNGNYGETGWVGLNTIALQFNYIVSSVAVMNEFYFEAGNDQYMQFTMCHEIGHGFGLNHTDENFANLNLGNCMDYTDRPESNEHPDETNFQVLAKLYGTVDGSSAPEVTPSLRGNDTKEQNGDNRFLFRNVDDSTSRRLPQWAHDKISEIKLSLFCERCEQHPGARRLYSSTALDSLQYDLGGGYVVRFHLVHPKLHR